MKLKMKRTILFLLVFLAALFSSCTAVYAEEQETQLDQIYSDFNVEEIRESVPDDTKKLLKELGLDSIDYTKIINITPKQIFNVIEDILLGCYASPLKCAAGIIGIILLSSVLKALQTTVESGGISSVFSFVCSAFVATIVVVNVSGCISNACSVIKLSSSFSMVFIPVFTLLVAMGGNPLAAVSFNTVLLGLAQVMNTLASTFLVPVANVLFGIGIVSGIKPELHFSSIVGFLKKNILLILSFASSAYMSLLTIKSSITSAADVVGEKSIRFAISTFVPVIGSAISEGLSSIKGYVSLAKSAVGIFGIIAIILIFLPSLVEILVWYFSMSFCSLCSEMFEEKSVYLVVKAIQDTLLILMIVLIFSMVLSLLSVGLMISVRGAQ